MALFLHYFYFGPTLLEQLGSCSGKLYLFGMEIVQPCKPDPNPTQNHMCHIQEEPKEKVQKKKKVVADDDDE